MDRLQSEFNHSDLIYIEWEKFTRDDLNYISFDNFIKNTEKLEKKALEHHFDIRLNKIENGKI